MRTGKSKKKYTLGNFTEEASCPRRKTATWYSARAQQDAGGRGMAPLFHAPLHSQKAGKQEAGGPHDPFLRCALPEGTMAIYRPVQYSSGSARNSFGFLLFFFPQYF